MLLRWVSAIAGRAGLGAKDEIMIKVTKLDHNEIIVNAELIQTIERTPDTVITLTTGQKIMVLEPVDLVIEKVITYKRGIFARPG
jgi:flagellar protein FlbD